MIEYSKVLMVAAGITLMQATHVSFDTQGSSTCCYPEMRPGLTALNRHDHWVQWSCLCRPGGGCHRCGSSMLRGYTTLQQELFLCWPP